MGQEVFFDIPDRETPDETNGNKAPDEPKGQKILDLKQMAKTTMSLAVLFCLVHLVLDPPAGITKTFPPALLERIDKIALTCVSFSWLPAVLVIPLKIAPVVVTASCIILVVVENKAAFALLDPCGVPLFLALVFLLFGIFLPDPAITYIVAFSLALAGTVVCLLKAKRSFLEGKKLKYFWKNSGREFKEGKIHISDKYALIIASAACLVTLVLLAVAFAISVPYAYRHGFSGVDRDVVEPLIPDSVTVKSDFVDMGKKQEVIEYAYSAAYTYCRVYVTEQMRFSYSGGQWNDEPDTVMISEDETWGNLETYWVDSNYTQGDQTYAGIYIRSFDGETICGEILYADPSGMTQAALEDVFTDCRPMPDSKDWGSHAFTYQINGTGVFSGSYIIVDKDAGVFFNSHETPMKQIGQTEYEYLRGPDYYLYDHVDSQEYENAPGSYMGTVVNFVNVNVRTGPGTNYDKVTMAETGTFFKYYGMESGWYKVDYNGSVCYVASNYLTKVSEPDLESGAVGVVATTTGLNVRTGPSTGYSIIDTVSTGSRLVYTGWEDGWYRVIYYDGRTGYVSGDYVYETY